LEATVADQVERAAAQIRAFTIRFLRNLGAELHSGGANKAGTSGGTGRSSLGGGSIGGGSIGVACQPIYAHLPPDLAAELGVPRELHIVFSPPVPAGAYYVTYGTPLLERMLELAASRGTGCHLLLSSGLDPGFVNMAMTRPYSALPEDAAIEESSGNIQPDSAYRRFCRTFTRLNIKNGLAEWHSRKLVHHQQVLFIFRVSFIADEKEEMIVPVLMDPITESPDTLVDLNAAVSFTPPLSGLPTLLEGTGAAKGSRGPAPDKTEAPDKAEAGKKPKSTGTVAKVSPLARLEPVPLSSFLARATDDLPREAYSLLRLYKQAGSHLSELVAAKAQAFREAAAGRMAAERERLEAYYRDLAAEQLEPLRRLFRRMAGVSVRAHLAHSYDDQLTCHKRLQELKAMAQELEQECQEGLSSLEKEKERRLHELAAGYAVRLEACLIAIAAIRVPRLQFTLHLSQASPDNGSRAREFSGIYDIWRDKLIDVACEVCDGDLDEASWCACDHLVCSRCQGRCPSCGLPVCAACAAGRCHLCQAYICHSCLITCPLTTGAGTGTSTGARADFSAGRRQLDELYICHTCSATYCEVCRRLTPSDGRPTPPLPDLTSLQLTGRKQKAIGNRK